ncbi:biotin--[acetyl-CoA-carboxylase] ligase [Candidatus Sumerlaeota bacterium]|nr:biotin--[acetyl-CoA-carboxylase] ligase [Candidatus Sumerlaeota bacterium]
MKGNRLSLKAIKGVLPCELIRWEAHYIPEAESTQDVAAEIFQKRLKPGIFVATNYQTRGRGRESRAWLSPRGDSLLFSLVLFPGNAPSHLRLLTMTMALSLCEAVRSHLGLKPEVKWPNDVLINGKKVCGILTEMMKTQEGEQAVIMGVGLNVNQNASAFPAEIRNSATSLSLEKSLKIPRLPLLAAIMKAFEDHYFLYQRGLFPEIIRKWKNYSSILGRHVTLRSGKREIQGVVIDLEDSGALVLRLDTGKTESFLSCDCLLE